MKQQIHLRGKGFSGRAVRIETLGPSECEQNLMDAAKLAGPEASQLEIKSLEWRNGVKRFIKTFTEPCESAVGTTTKFRAPKDGEFDDLDTIFTVKDVQVLTAIFKIHHEVMQSELDAIMGEAINLSED